MLDSWTIFSVVAVVLGSLLLMKPTLVLHEYDKVCILLFLKKVILSLAVVSPNDPCNPISCIHRYSTVTATALI